MFNNPIMKNRPKFERMKNRPKFESDFEMGILHTNTIPHKVIAAKPTLIRTIVSGGNSLTAKPTKKKEPPQTTDNNNSMLQSFAVIELVIVKFMNSSLI